MSESDRRFVNFVIFSNGTLFALFALSGPSDKRAAVNANGVNDES